MRDRIENVVELDNGSVWVLSNWKHFNYSDGILSERYLKKVFSSVNDLGSDSNELQHWIKDWPSEYHLSHKRSQLLKGFDFERSKKVLEVGCGCGAITRFLGETFEDVLSIEGSLSRAHLARMRTKDMKNVSILCGGFQEVIFKEKFDIIFCIGVYEYSGSFVCADDPYDYILNYFNNILNSDGVLVLAIENQFGLKYFASSKEDHTNRMFDGIEGYPFYRGKIKTFGYDELKHRLKKYFSSIDYYFPFPDYKIPSCVLSEKFLEKVKAGELVGNLKARDYCFDKKPLFDEKLAYFELDKNNKLPFFSNSFLVISGKQCTNSIKPQALGILHSTDRAEEYHTVTRFIEHTDNGILAIKMPVKMDERNTSEFLKLIPTTCKWESGLSLQGTIIRRVKEKDIALDELFTPCKIWVEKIKNLSTYENSRFFVDGKYIDLIWRNCYLHDKDCVFVDQEWVWHEKVNMNVVIIRAIYCFLHDISDISSKTSVLKGNNMRYLIKNIARSLGVEVNRSDFREFLNVESKFYSIVGNRNLIRTRLGIGLFLYNNAIFGYVHALGAGMDRIRNLKDRLINHLFRIILSKAID